MMIKVFLVEDEFTVRERMKKNVEWEEYGFELVGEAGDGEMAYPMILETQPDIIITDIKMPFMDGLELSSLVKEAMPDIKIIILSGYDEFEYAKRAISIGITDYLLKPISAKKLIESMNKVKCVIKEERKKAESLKAYLANEKENKNGARKKFFNELVTCKQGMAELIERANALDIKLMASGYNILLLKILFQEATLGYYDEVQGKLTEALRRWCEDEQSYILFNRETEGWAILLKQNRGECNKNEEEAVKDIQEIMKEYATLSYCIGVGERVYRVSEIATAFDKANKALSYRYLLRDREVIYYSQLEAYSTTIEREEISITHLDVSKFDEKTINDFLRTGIKGQVAEFAKNYLKSMGPGTDSFLFRQYIMMDIYLNVVSFVEQLGYEKSYIVEKCGDIHQIKDVLQTIEKSEVYLENLLMTALSLRDEISGKRYGNLLEEAKIYIELNYNQESISLNSVAEHVNISPSHFSAIFSQEIGQTFISYLTDIRMKKAKELLRCSSMKTLEVGFSVGYRDPHYFSYLFKKTQNCTPKEYRKRNEDKH